MSKEVKSNRERNSNIFIICSELMKEMRLLTLLKRAVPCVILTSLVTFVTVNYVYFRYNSSTLRQTKLDTVPLDPGKLMMLVNSVKQTPSDEIPNAIKFNMKGMFSNSKKEDNVHNFDVLISPSEDLCNQDTILLVAIIITRPESFEIRNAIRNTWGSQNSTNLKYIFAIGKSEIDLVNNQLELEGQKYGDILQENFPDNKEHTTVKVMMAFKWVKYSCNNAKFVLKTGQDILINTISLLKHLNHLSKASNALFGALRLNEPVDRKVQSERYIPFKMYHYYDFKNQNYLLPYCDGTAIIMTCDLAVGVYDLSLSIIWPPFSTILDDIYLSMLALHLDAQFVQINQHFITASHLLEPSEYKKPSFLLRSVYFVQVDQLSDYKRSWDFFITTHKLESEKKKN